MTVRFSRRAIADLSDIGDYLVQHNPSAAMRVELAIRSTIDLLSDYPKLGRDRPELQSRSIGVPRCPYTVYYRVENAEIWILHIRDDRRDAASSDDLD